MEEKNSEKLLKNVLTIVVILLLGWSIGYILMGTDKEESKNKKEIKAQLKRIEEVLENLDEEYVGEIDFNKAGSEAMDAILQSTGDPYTRYLSKEEFNDVVNSGYEEYAGIGVHLVYSYEGKSASVVSVMPDTPAQAADIRIGDEITTVEDIVISDIKSYTDSAAKLRGKEGTKVTLTIKRGEETLKKEIIRKIIKVNNVTSRLMDNVGYIKILEFDNKANEEFEAELKKLKAKNIKGLIIDLRNNPGGMVPPTVKIADMLLPDGDVILKTKYKNGDVKIDKAKDGKKEDMPIVVLVNGNSASASEILTSSLKDYNAATIIGQKTYGKGIVQGVIPLKEDDAASITIAKYYTKAEKEIHKKGIEPDIKVEVSKEEANSIVIKPEEDTVLKRGLEEIKKLIK